MLVTPRIMTKWDGTAKPYCRCWHNKPKVSAPARRDQLNECACGEEYDIKEWKWQKPTELESSWVVLSNNDEMVTFHPFYSSGTAAVKGDTPLQLNCHYYWEVKMLTDTYGTDIMVGLCTEKFDITEYRHMFASLLGNDTESYGLSYTGTVRHNSKVVTEESHGFCKGSIVGMRLDMWQGTLEFYINRKPQGVSFYNLRRHPALYPVVCSTAAQSSMKIVYAASWKASLMVDALRILSASVKDKALAQLPPGLSHTLKTQFWLTMPSRGNGPKRAVFRKNLMMFLRYKYPNTTEDIGCICEDPVWPTKRVPMELPRICFRYLNEYMTVQCTDAPART